ncbi:MAG: alpha-2-macroglobulin family protein [Pseudothermotoga sp.]|uniref:alpha-2-macroglobulin family protein n=1 Tax=Pseudothermotoga sp. TaxID=2033661 RepID=UPI002584B01D|nr:MG2 domain-containing protein [Pseudothermotoga sp.]MDI6862328.1 alpha-2-macroglobulin family protein [Pseudothermotoga sp.]
MFFVSLLVFLSVLSIANHAYFSQAGLLVKGQDLRFIVYGRNFKSVVLTIWEVKNERALLSKLFEGQTVVQPELGKVVLKRTYAPLKDWETFSLKFDRLGTYYATLTGRDERGRETVFDETFLIVTDMEAIHFNDGERTILCVMKKDGGFVNDAEVLFYKDSKLVLKAKTDTNGMAICENACDFFYVKKENTSIFGELYFPYKAEYADEKLFLITDRPIYKPNDVVKFRGQLFSKRDNLYEALGASSVRVIVKDPKDNDVYTQDLITDELGGFFDEFKLPETAAVGVYEINVVRGERTYYNSFMVEEYRKPEYKISIEISQEPIFSGQTLKFSIHVTYFNNQPVPHAQVAYYVHANPYDGEPFLAYRGLEATDETGSLSVEVRIDEGFDGHYTIEVIATDESQRQVEETKSVRVWADDVNIQLEDEYVWTSPGEEVKIPLTITNVDGEPLDGTLTVNVDGAIKNVSVVDGKAEFVFVPEKAKTYRIELIFKKAKKHIYVHAFAKRYKPSELILMVDQKKVRPKQTIQVDLASSHRITGLLTLLADKIYEAIAIDALEQSSVKLKVPEKVSERNLFVVFLGLEGGRRVQKELTVSVERELNLSTLKIEFDKEKYEPGDTAVMKIEADANNVCLMLVDEAIYAMVRRDPPNLEDFLYPENDYPTVSYDFAYTWRLYSAARVMIAELKSKETSFEDFKKSAVMEKINVREYFPDTALWIPSLTMEGGVATIRFKVPDSITMFRATAYGFSRSLFSQGSGSMSVTKPFYVRPHLPSFFRENDVVCIGTTIFNQTEEPLKTNHWVELPDSVKAMRSVAGETIVQPNSSFTQSFLVQAVQPLDPSTLTFYAVSKLTDAIAINVPVKPFAFEREFYFLEKIEGKRNFSLPEGEYVRAKLRILTNVTLILSQSIQRLIHYPYGCTEQTMSSFLPAVVAAKMGLQIANLDDIVQKGLFKLYDHQHPDGGWGWWKTDESHPLMSAYVMEGLYHAIQAGYHVPNAVVQRGIEYLSENLSGYGVYVLSLYGISVESFEPKNDVDLIFSAIVSAESLQDALKLVEENERFARVKIKPEDHFVSEVQLSAVLLRAILRWQKDSSLVPKLINYLLSKKDGYFWYSTKDTSFCVLALLEALPTYDRPHLSIRNDGKEFFLDVEGEIPIEKGSLEIEGKGLVEIHVIYLERPVGSVSEGLKIERQIYKRYELYLEEDKQVIDAFIPVGTNLIPISIERSKFNDKILRIHAHQYDELRNFEHGGVKFSVLGNRLTLFNANYGFEKIVAGSGLIVAKLENDAALICETKSKKIVVHQDVGDIALFGSKVLILKENMLWLNEIPLTAVPNDVEEITCTDREILLKARDVTYWLKDGRFSVLPFTARNVYQWDGENLVASGIRFSGNDSVIQDTTFRVTFKFEPVKLQSGDIAKTVLKIGKCDGQYLVVEDFFASCAQVLTNYRERNLKSYDKFDYGWYRLWDFWYSARELHEDRIAFFATYCEHDTFSYVWRVTADGIYQLLPARVYSMYKQGLYAHSDPSVLHVGLGGEDLAGR